MKSVIVIDNDKDIVRLFSEFLTENNIRVVGKGFSGTDAVSLFRKTKPDVILLDIMMPNGSGFYAIKKIREINSEAKIIAVTADMTSNTEEKLKKLSVPIVYKPFEMQNIINFINR